MSKSDASLAGTFDDGGGGPGHSAFLGVCRNGIEVCQIGALQPVAPGKKKGRSYGRPAFPITRQDLQGAINQGLFLEGAGSAFWDGELLKRILYSFSSASCSPTLM